MTVSNGTAIQWVTVIRTTYSWAWANAEVGGSSIQQIRGRGHVLLDDEDVV